MNEMKCAEGLYSSQVGDNSLLFSRVFPFYVPVGAKVADVTYGKGTFWKKLDMSQWDFHKSDLMTCENRYDFRCLPYSADSFDAVIFDPPYVHDPGNMHINPAYQNKETTKGFYHKDIINLYDQGMVEAVRVLKTSGLLFVKCMDEIESSKQKMSHIEIYDIALRLKMTCEDLFVLTRTHQPVIQIKKQRHARKNHSYLWVFRK